MPCQHLRYNNLSTLVMVLAEICDIWSALLVYICVVPDFFRLYTLSIRAQYLGTRIWSIGHIFTSSKQSKCYTLLSIGQKGLIHSLPIITLPRGDQEASARGRFLEFLNNDQINVTTTKNTLHNTIKIGLKFYGLNYRLKRSEQQLQQHHKIKQ